MINFRMLKLSDPLLWISVLGLAVFSFLAIFSSTFNLQLKAGGDPFFFVKKQFFSLIIALAGLLFFAYLDYKRLKKISPLLYLANLALLTLVLFSGKGAQGAQRWFYLGPLSFQPSEISKMIIIISIAAFLNERAKIRSVWEALGLLSLVGLPFFLIFKQPDLGTALVFIAVLMGMLAASKTSPKLLLFLTTPVISLLLRPWVFGWIVYLLILALCLFLFRASFWEWLYIFGVNVLVGIAVPFIWGLLKAYQRQRILAFLNPASDPYGAGYHSLQSKIAVGGGGFWGRGFLHGTQTQLQFIPEQHSDFIFSAVGEEFGFIGAAVLLLSFALLIWRALVIGANAMDRFGYLLASGIAAMIIFHVFANVGMVLGLLPVVGIPLPLVSFGGSSFFINFAAVGILQSIAMRRQKLIF